MLVMLDLLDEIKATGKIGRAAERAGLSYRHSWNLVEKWSDFFGTPLVERRRGSGTRLTAFGERLVLADQRLRARIEPQLQNLAQELETEINGLLPDSRPRFRIRASHGFAVSMLRETLLDESEVPIDLRYVGTRVALSSLASRHCDLAGVHLPLGPLRAASAAAVSDWLDPDIHAAIGFVRREMGLMVARGNPLRVDGVARLAGTGVRFVNREIGSGTRRLLEQILAQHGLEPALVDGYERVEHTHVAVAASVASGIADAAFGVEAAARLFDLDFLRLATEDYFFVCHRQALESGRLQPVLAILQSERFQASLGQLPGYVASGCGRVMSIKDALLDVS